MLALRWTFPQSKIEAATLEVYAERLVDIPLPVLEQAVERMMDTGTWFPTLAAIRSAAAEIMTDTPTEDEALAAVEDIISWARLPEDQRGPRPALHPVARKALDHVGGFYAFKNTEPAIIRGQFLRLYRDLRAREILAVQVRDLPELDPGHNRPELTVS